MKRTVRIKRRKRCTRLRSANAKLQGQLKTEQRVQDAMGGALEYEYQAHWRTKQALDEAQSQADFWLDLFHEEHARHQNTDRALKRSNIWLCVLAGMYTVDLVVTAVKYFN